MFCAFPDDCKKLRKTRLSTGCKRQKLPKYPLNCRCKAQANTTSYKRVHKMCFFFARVAPLKAEKMALHCRKVFFLSVWEGGRITCSQNTKTFSEKGCCVPKTNTASHGWFNEPFVFARVLRQKRKCLGSAEGANKEYYPSLASKR